MLSTQVFLERFLNHKEDKTVNAFLNLIFHGIKIVRCINISQRQSVFTFKQLMTF